MVAWVTNAMTIRPLIWRRERTIPAGLPSKDKPQGYDEDWKFWLAIMQVTKGKQSWPRSLLSQRSKIKLRPKINLPRLGIVRHLGAKPFVDHLAVVYQIGAIHQFESFARVVVRNQDAQTAVPLAGG